MSALLLKEWREHRVVLVVLLLACLAMVLVERQMALDAISPLHAWHGMTVRFGVLAAMYLANRLVMREYGAGTQLFLETLPVSRSAVILVKWGAGCCWLLLMMAAAFALILLDARDRVPLDAIFVAGIGVRSLGFLLLAYGVAFAVALTLRLRFFVWGVLLGAAMLLNQVVQLPPGDWAPFYLVKQTMVLERVLPWPQLAITMALAAGAFAAALAIALLARGALVTAFARRPSARTRTVMVLLFALCMWATTLLQPKVEPPPVKLDAAVIGDAGPRVEIGWQRAIAGVPAAQAAHDIARDLASLQAWLGLGPLADTLLVADAWHEADEFRLNHAAPGQVVLNAALGDPALSLEQLKAEVRLVQILDQAPLYRWREDRYWLLFGLAEYWEMRGNPARAVLLERRARTAAAWLRHAGMDYAGALRQGARTDERLGSCLNAALSARAVQLLADRLGEAGLRALMRKALAPASDDLWSLLRVRSLDSLLDEAGVPLPALAARLEAALPPAALTAPPRLLVQAAPLQGEQRELRYRVINRPPGERVTLRYQLLHPGEIRTDERQARSLPAGDAGVLPATFIKGSRVLVTGRAYDASLACHYHFGAVHQEIP